MRWIWLILLVGRLQAQDFGFANIPFLGGSSTTRIPFPLLSGLYFHWTDQDLPLGVNTIWKDEIQGVNLVVTNNAPSMTSSGLVFLVNGPMYSTNTTANQYGSVNYSSYVVFSANNGMSSSDRWYVFDDSITLPGENSTFVLDNAGNYQLWEFSLSGSPSSQQLSPNLTPGQLYDWEFGSTNGVVITYVDATKFSNPTGISPGWVRIGQNGFVQGRICEIAIWTNLDMTATRALMLHTNRLQVHGP